MKKNVLTLMAIATIITVACQKQNPTPVLNSTTSSSKENTKIWDQVKSNGEPMADETWFDDGGNTEGVDYGCKKPATDCITGAFVTPKFVTSVEDLSNSSNQGSYAESHYDILTEFIYDGHIDRVISGDYKVELRGNITDSSSGYLVFRDDSENVVIVYKFRL